MELLKNWILIVILSIILILVLLSIPLSSFRFKILDTVCLLFGAAALLQLEISGLFAKLVGELGRIQAESESNITPSHVPRNLYNNIPIKSEKLISIQFSLFSNKICGFYFSMIGLLLQVILTWSR